MPVRRHLDPPRVVPSLALLAVLASPTAAWAYIGPGAGFALGGSFIFALAGVLLAIGALFLWPIRVAVRTFRGRRRSGRGSAKRVIVVGLDGLDPILCDDFMARGLMPNLKQLADAGGYRQLATTLPAMSPVGWSTFATGTDPSGHNIFDFLTTDRRTHSPVLSSTRITETGRLRKLGPWVIGRPKAKFELLRRSKPFWKILAEQGVPSTILRVPITFPPDKFGGRMLSAMCVPDLRGTQGSFTHFSAPVADAGREAMGGTRLVFDVLDADTYAGRLPGPDMPTEDGGHAPALLPFTVQVDRGARRAHFEVGDATFTLATDEYSPWIPVKFGSGRATAHGICRFRVTSFDEPFQVYVTPINLDPEHPDMPISDPPHFAIALAKLQGKFATLGLAEDTWALNERVIDERAFLEQAYLIHQERRTQFLHAMDRNPTGTVAVVFDATDRIQHMFWRYREADHPANAGQDTTEFKSAIADVYAAGDAVVGETLAKARRGDAVLVISDHGFADFSRGVNLNTWFRDHGYLFLKDDPARRLLGNRLAPHPRLHEWSRGLVPEPQGTRAGRLRRAGPGARTAGRDQCQTQRPGRSPGRRGHPRELGRRGRLPRPLREQRPGRPRGLPTTGAPGRATTAWTRNRCLAWSTPTVPCHVTTARWSTWRPRCWTSSASPNPGTCTVAACSRKSDENYHGHADPVAGGHLRRGRHQGARPGLRRHGPEHAPAVA